MGPADGQHSGNVSGHVQQVCCTELNEFLRQRTRGVVVPGCCNYVWRSHPYQGLVKELGKQEELWTQTPRTRRGWRVPPPSPCPGFQRSYACPG